MPVTPYAGPSGYTPFYLSIYDTYVLRLSMPVYWGFSTNNDLRPLFSGNFSKRHVNIGVGTGYFLAEAMPSIPSPQQENASYLIIQTLTSAAPHWRNHLSTDDLPGLLDHKLRNDVVFPFAAYIAIAGEAIRQITHSPRDSGYRLRHTVAHNALLLADTVEISTSLRNHNLNDMDGSSWYDFTVSSYSGSFWSKHYTGQLSHVYFIYGSHSWGVKSATSSTTSELVHAEITIIESQSRSHFTLHPATIDAESRLLILSEARGLARNVPELAVPTVIEEIEISVGADILDARAWRRFRVVPCVEVYAHGNIAFRATGIRFRPLDHDNASSDLLDAHAIARLHWLPHFGFVDTSTLIGSPVVDREELLFTRKIDPMLHYRSIRELITSSPVSLTLSNIKTGLANRHQNGGNKKDDPDVSGGE
ncbi:hypothetical protein QWA68_013498 [Fusarium oxysporum]|nr:hypothetical protein QWA68_013498 [Fusarium oxysporum]